MKRQYTKKTLPRSISLESSHVEFECESKVPTDCPRTIDVEINLPLGSLCLTPPKVKIEFDGKVTKSPLKLKLKGRVVERKK